MPLIGRITRPLAVLAAATMVAGLAATPAQAAAKNDPRPARSGAGWLAGELTGGLVHNEQFDFDDVGLSIDVALGLHAAGRKPLVVQRITNAVADNVGFYTSFPPSTYAGATAKAAVLAQSTERNARAFGGVDLIAQLEGLVASSAPITGRIEDAYDPADPFGGDFANVIGQAYAAQSLSEARSPKAAAATRFLLKQQCRAGFFRLNFNADKTESNQACNGAPKVERAPDTDATVIALLALMEVKQTATTKARIARAADWLVAHQQANGSFGGGTSTDGANTNSTGLAGYVLGLLGRAAPAAKAAVWVRGLQVPAKNPCARALGREAGAIAYDAVAYRKGQRTGINDRSSDQWRRASAQALPVLRWAPRAVGAFAASAPRTARAGEGLTIRVRGVARGQRVCVSEGDFTYEVLPGRNAITQVRFVLDGRTGLRTFKVWLGGQRRDVTVRVTR